MYPSTCTEASLFGLARQLTLDEWEAKHPEWHAQASLEEIREFVRLVGMATSRQQHQQMAIARSTVASKDQWDVAASA